MTRVVVTGGSGFIGTNLVEYYRCNGHDVVSLDIESPRCAAHTSLWRRVDLLDARALREAIAVADPELVFHMAARTDLAGRVADDYRANTAGVENLIASLTSARALRLVVFASSLLVCRIGYVPRDELDYCPSTPYGDSKVAGERIVRERLGQRLPWVIVRPTSIWGPWFAAPYRDFFEAVRHGWYFHPKGLRVPRSYGYVGNAVHLLARLAELGGGALLGRTVYLADYEPIDIGTWASQIAAEFGRRPITELPLPLFRAAALAGDFLSRLGWRSPPMTSFRLTNMLTAMVSDVTPWRSLVPVLPHSTEEGIRSTCDWLRRSA